MENPSNLIMNNINIEFQIPDKETKSFISIFKFIRKKLQIKESRKNHLDSILKKSKGQFFKAVFEGIKLCLNIVVSRLPQEFITNITIEYNKKFFHKKIIEIYNEFNILPSLNEIIENNLFKIGKLDIFKEIVCNDFMSLYDIYINSEKFKKDINTIKIEKGKRTSILYEFVARNFIVYYYEKKESKRKKKKSIFKISNK